MRYYHMFMAEPPDNVKTLVLDNCLDDPAKRFFGTWLGDLLKKHQPPTWQQQLDFLLSSYMTEDRKGELWKPLFSCVMHKHSDLPSFFRHFANLRRRAEYALGENTLTETLVFHLFVEALRPHHTDLYTEARSWQARLSHTDRPPSVLTLFQDLTRTAAAQAAATRSSPAAMTLALVDAQVAAGPSAEAGPSTAAASLHATHAAPSRSYDRGRSPERSFGRGGDRSGERRGDGDASERRSFSRDRRAGPGGRPRSPSPRRGRSPSPPRTDQPAWPKGLVRSPEQFAQCAAEGLCYICMEPASTHEFPGWYNCPCVFGERSPAGRDLKLTPNSGRSGSPRSGSWRKPT